MSLKMKYVEMKYNVMEWMTVSYDRTVTWINISFGLVQIDWVKELKFKPQLCLQIDVKFIKRFVSVVLQGKGW